MVHITDMDTIEKSNLSRQFLFRANNIGGLKSRCAADAVQHINPAMNITAYESRVGSDTQELFNDRFFESLDGVCNALDNVEARLYMDGRCLFYQKPLLESGTLGTKGNTQVVVPHLTEHYGASRDPPEKSIPVCTLKNFPNQIEHTLQWARDWFEGEFKQTPDDTNQYLTCADFAQTITQNSKIETFQRVAQSLVDERPITMDDCIVWARLRFEQCFNNSIRQLLHNFPADQVTTTGQQFWSGSKRQPVPLEFDPVDPVHLGYIKAAANLRASNYGISGTWEDTYFVRVVSNVQVPHFVPKDGMKISANEKEEEESKNQSVDTMDTEAMCQHILSRIPPPKALAGFHVTPIDFDKDVDNHMLFVTACSNLRARNYQIPEADMHRSRLIAGKIIPAIATTTALVTGLVCIELYKVVQKKPLEAFKNSFVNLAIPLFALSEPIPPAKTLAKITKEGRPFEWHFSAWDSFDVRLGNLTLKELVDHLQDDYGLEVTMLSHGVSILWSFFLNQKKSKARMKMSMTDLVLEVTKSKIPDGQKYLCCEVMCSTDEEDEVDVPSLRIILES
uniref:Ubiquitin-activating enzyme E1 C-terminal domain-containing protein n=1 Tax=Octactis speculum TaxID=3111310 RepID=A0A7S2B3Z9_9STRA